MNPLRLAALLAMAPLMGCATRGVIFEGHAEPRVARARDLLELADMPAGYERVGRLAARCTLVEGERPEPEARLVDVDCSEARLVAALREKAADVGGEALIGRRCRSRVSGSGEGSTTLDISCDTEVARPTGDTLVRRPLVSGVMSEDDAPRAEEAWHIRVSFAPAPGVPLRPPRRADLVREVPYMPGANLRLGDIVTRCHEGCTRDGARLGLLAAAGRVGASDVVDVTCAAMGNGYVCTGVATAHEVNPELEPKAR